MIEKIRKALIIKYTIIITCLLCLGFAASYTAYRHAGIKLLHDSLYDYLNEEVWEAGEFLNKYNNDKAEINKNKSDIKSLHNFTYWIVDKKIVYADQPQDETIAKRLEQRLLTKDFKDKKIYHENAKSRKQKWYFIIIKQTLPDDVVKNGEVFVLANYTPIRKSAKTYIKIAVFAVGIMILLSYLTGSFLAARSMKYIEQNYEKQKKFVSDAAHELRTPLAILYSYAELMEYNFPKNDTINDIKDEIQRMNDLVDRLLSIARFDNSINVLQKEYFSLNELIVNVVKSMKQLNPTAVFVFDDNGTKINIEADKVMVRQVFNIMLDNAIKYTNDNKNIIIKLSKPSSMVKISIEDNGIGIKKEDLPHIFDRFWQAEKSRHQKGLGLGLSLVEAIVKLHNGSINVKSEFGKGTIFEISLPLIQRG